MTGPHYAAMTRLPDRTLPGSGSSSGEGGEISSLNLLFIVGFAVLISVLARHLARRGGKGGKGR